MFFRIKDAGGSRDNGKAIGWLGVGLSFMVHGSCSNRKV